MHGLTWYSLSYFYLRLIDIRDPMSRAKTSTLVIIILSIVLLGAVSWGVYQYLIITSQAQRIHGLEEVAALNAPLEQRLVQQQMDLDSLRHQLADLELEYAPLQKYLDSAEGVYFEVQIGQYRYVDLIAYQPGLVDLRQASENGIHQILLGRYEQLEQAESLLSLVHRVGLRTAFIVGRINGRIVPMDEAIRFAATSNNSYEQNVY